MYTNKNCVRFRWTYGACFTMIFPKRWPAETHYNDVRMTTMASQITSLTVVYSTVYSDADQRKHQSSASLAFVWGSPRERWIPRTKGQLRGKCFHLMTSSWKCIISHVMRTNFLLYGNISALQNMGYYNKLNFTKSLGVYYWYVKMPQCGYMEHRLKDVVMFKTYSTSSNLLYPDGSRHGARGARICELVYSARLSRAHTVYYIYESMALW